MTDDEYKIMLKGIGIFIGMYLALFTLVYALGIRHETNQGKFTSISIVMFGFGMMMFFAGFTKEEEKEEKSSETSFWLGKSSDFLPSLKRNVSSEMIL